MIKIKKDTLGKIFLVLWAVTMIIVFSFQMATHLLAMPLPNNISLIQKTLQKYQNKKQWIYAHIIYDKCSCTSLLFEHLLKRGSMKESKEIIFLVGSSSQYKERLKNKGFIFKSLERKYAEENYGIEAAPILAILNTSGQLKYVGGYFSTSAAKRPKDMEISTKIKTGLSVKALPLYGCAISDQLKSYVDPLGLAEI